MWVAIQSPCIQSSMSVGTGIHECYRRITWQVISSEPPGLKRGGTNTLRSRRRLVLQTNRSIMDSRMMLVLLPIRKEVTRSIAEQATVVPLRALPESSKNSKSQLAKSVPTETCWTIKVALAVCRWRRQEDAATRLPSHTRAQDRKTRI